MICNDLVAKPQYFDVMVLMVGYERLLGPLCSIIDTWPMVEDYGGYKIFIYKASLTKTNRISTVVRRIWCLFSARHGLCEAL
jgi:hypothetical protein